MQTKKLYYDTNKCTATGNLLVMFVEVVDSLPLILAPSLDFLIPVLALLSAQSGTAVACRGQCTEAEEPVAPAHPIREVLLSVMVTCGVCAALVHWGHVPLNSVTHMLLTKRNATFIQSRNGPHSPDFVFPNDSVPWLDFPLPTPALPLLSGKSIAAGVAGGLSSSISSLAVYVVAARLLKAPVPPAHACNRGLCVDGLGSVLSGLMGAPVGLCSSVPNACVIGLSQSGSRSTVQLAGVLLLILGVSPQLAQMLFSVPLAIHGAVLGVTYTLAVATGITYFQHADVDSGRNIFNIGFTVFMSLALPSWFRLHSSFIQTGVHSVDVFLQSLLTLPVFFVGVLAFLLEHTVSGTLPERGLVRHDCTKKILSLADQQQGYSHSPNAVYDPPPLVMKVLDLSGLRTVPFCACRSPPVEEVVVTEMSSLLPDKDAGVSSG
ncbi:solute carrier family 23 member 3-like [Sinocyclocheilus grahami]|uniref:solute carrier family 23 member 3-like n=1 Tax=Sinocyclocheilus grahami TaxID=75366 RepID=UPI0007AC73A8|nr:PREDICTED: solute carrier family 23 member 3-like [Sinocyclocheilus grahami]